MMLQDLVVKTDADLDNRVACLALARLWSHQESEQALQILPDGTRTTGCLDGSETARADRCSSTRF